MTSRKSVSTRPNALRLSHAARALSVLAGLTGPSLALADLPFSQSPPMNSSSSAALPNVIVGVDVTDSMIVNTDAACIPGTGKTYTVGQQGTSDYTSYTTGGNCRYYPNNHDDLNVPAGYYQDRMTALRDALVTTFSDSSLVGKIRLAYQSSYWDYGFGPNRFFKNPYGFDNSMKLFDADYQAQFIKWGANVEVFWCSPTAPLITNAGEYLKGNWMAPNNSYYGASPTINSIASFHVPAGYDNTNNPNKYNITALNNWYISCGYNDTDTGITAPAANPANYLTYTSFKGSPQNNPWNSTSSLGTTTVAPVTDPNPPLACRRSYFIFMTDGASNGALFSMKSITGNTNDDNYDGKPHKLPDGQVYDPDQDYATLYKDSTTYGNLADAAFYYWATDLTGKGAGVVDTKNTMPVTTDTTYGTKTYPPYWNPQNDPATWQHMQTYAIGFGTAPSGAGQISAASTTPDGNPYANWTVCTKNWFADSYWGTPSICKLLGTDGVAMPAFDSQFGNFLSGYASGTYTWPYTLGYSDNNRAANLIGSVEFVLDLPHATYNGRGRFFPATTAGALADAFSSILQTAMTESASGGKASASASGGQLNNGTVAYEASYTYDTDGSKTQYDTANKWWGTTSNDLITGTINGWAGAVAATRGDTWYTGALWANGASIPATRHIFTADSSGKGISFAWLNTLTDDPLAQAVGLTQADVNAVLHNPLGDIVNSQLAYVGKPSLLSLNEGYITFADNNSGRTNVLYVGANDGMLHGFNAGQGSPSNSGSGQELMAYVPRGLWRNLHLYSFANSNYAHRYWVDGSPFSADAQTAAPDPDNTDNPGGWATVLVGTLGAGGPGYFVLDVTDPASFADGNLDVLIDATDTSDTGPLKDQTVTNGPLAGLPASRIIGSQFSRPVMDMYAPAQSAQITRINTTDPNGEWGVIMGNGYNNALGIPVLLIQSLSKRVGGDSGPLALYSVSALCMSPDNDCSGNGLGAPRPIDVDGNGTADIVYAGDLMGNLWKFDISNPNHSQWQVANTKDSLPAPLFTAVGPTGVRQPITSAPVVVPNPNKGFMVAFGTGKNLTDADALDTNLNSVYVVYDNEPMQFAGSGTTASQVLLGESTADETRPSPSPIPASCLGTSTDRYDRCLYRQGYGDATHANSTGGTLAEANDDGVRVGITGSRTGQQIDGQHYYGWYFDIPDIINSNAGKVLDNLMVMPGNVLLFYTQNLANSSDTGSTAESCDPSGGNSAKRVVNYLDLFTGNAPDNTITVGGVEYSAGEGNRFEIEGTFNLLAADANTLVTLGKNMKITLTPPAAPPGRRIGWRIGR